jgi:hypothetical protein
MPYIKGGGAQKNSGLPAVSDVYHSDNVYANFVPVALWQDPQGSEAASLALINSPSYKVEAAFIELDGETNEVVVEANLQKLISTGVITQAELSLGDNAAASATNVDTTPASTATTTTTTTGSVTLATSVDDTVLYVSTVTDITYYVKTVTKVPGVSFPYDVATVAIQNGVTVQSVVDNLRLLVINCYDPIKAEYPDALMTCSFRLRDPKSPGSQHPLGMACDIQYSKASKADYFTRAQWVKDNIVYDQFLLEWKTIGSKLPWHHISFNKAGNRKQVFTFMNNKNCKGPGVAGLYDLSNT